MTEAERFWSKVDKTPSCWNWTGSTRGLGYGQFYLDGSKATYAHRWAYEHVIGPIPEGHQIDHLCSNRRCVNPYHLEPVTQHINLLRAMRKPYCQRGHRFDGDNVIWDKGRRRCRECRNQLQRARYHAGRAA